MPHGPGALSALILFVALYVSMIVGEEASMGGSGVDALSSETKASGGSSDHRFPVGYQFPILRTFVELIS